MNNSNCKHPLNIFEKRAEVFLLTSSYSANLMKLSIVASDPLDVTLQRTLEFFSGVPNKNTLPTMFQPDPYPSSLNMVCPKLLYVSQTAELLC